MSKLAQNFAKYVIYAKLSASGVIEKPDVIGAIFGQTEGLLGNDLDLRELQRTGRIGRIEVSVKTEKGNTLAHIIIPSSMDASETSLIAASLETIDKVGPCDAKIEIERVEDVRSSKRSYVVGRAKEILKVMFDDSSETQKLSESVKEAVRTLEVSKYAGLTAGPDIEESDEIILVEGRADVINLLKNGIKNVIAIEGSKIPEQVIKITKEKTTTAFMDGDRGGDLDLKKLMAVAEIDYIARADDGFEVEELTNKQIYKALREKTSIEHFDVNVKRRGVVKTQKEDRNPDKETLTFFNNTLNDLTGTRAVVIVNKEMKIVGKFPLSELNEAINNFSDIYAVVFDGKINQSIVDLVSKRKIEYLIGTFFKENIHSKNTIVLSQKDIVK